jgi:hypothetical protein
MADTPMVSVPPPAAVISSSSQTAQVRLESAFPGIWE